MVCSILYLVYYLFSTMFLPCLLHCDYLFDICLLFKLTFILILFTRISRNYMLTANVARECGLINPSSYQVVQNRVTTYNKKYIICVASRAVAREGAGGGGIPPPLIPFAPRRQFSKLSTSRRSVRENAMVFSHKAILTCKAFTSDQN